MADDTNQDTGGKQPGLIPPAPEEDCPRGAPKWMCTFADMVTLLMCFFVLLFAMSTIQEETFKELIQSIKSSLGVQQVPETGTREGLMMAPGAPREAKEKKPEIQAVDELGGMVQKEVKEIVSDVKELIMFNKLGGQVQVEENENGAVITIADVALFKPGQAEISEKGLKIMEKVAKVLAQFSYPIKVTGHTDNIPIHTPKFASNWELSAVRASDVVRYFISTGIDPKLLSAEGHAEYRPIADNKTPEGRAKNRRVEIIYERTKIARHLSH